MTGSQTQTGVFASSAIGGSWWLVEQAIRHGPSWSLVPPLLFATASLIGASSSYLNGRQARRHAEERHRAELLKASREGAARRGFTFDQPGGRNGTK